MTTAAAYIPGVQNTGTIFSEEKRIEVPEKLFWLRPEATPFIHLTGGPGKVASKLRSKTVGNMEFKVFEKKPHAIWSAINFGAGYGIGDVTLVLDSVAHIAIGDVLEVVRTKEKLLVTNKNNGASTITVRRAFGTTAAAAILDNDPLVKIGTAFEEFGSYAQIVMVKNSSRVNYCQHFKKSYGLSNIARDTVMYTGPKEPELAKEAMYDIKIDKELAFLMGEPYYSATGGPDGTPIWATGGAYYWISSGGGVVETATPNYDRVKFNRFLARGFEEGSDTRVGLLGTLILDAIEYWKDQKVEYRQSEEFFNLKVATWENTRGRLVFARDRILTNSPVGNLNLGYGGLGFLFDMEGFWENQFNNNGLHLYPDIVKDGKTGKIHEYREISGLGVENPERSSIIEDFTTFS